MKLSFICPSNNPEMYSRCVLASLERQKNRDFELILVDTQKEQYSSAAAALNAGAARASGEYLVFLHHDIILEDENFIDQLLELISRGDFLIGGVAGAVKGKYPWRKQTVSNIVHGEKKVIPGKTPTTRIIPLSTVDECFFVIPRRVFMERGFVEYMPGWHLYAVDYCMWAQAKGGEGAVVLLPARLWHLSIAKSMSADYYATLRAVRKAHRRDMYTTMGAWPANRLLFEYRVARDRYARAKRARKAQK